MLVRAAVWYVDDREEGNEEMGTRPGANSVNKNARQRCQNV